MTDKPLVSIGLATKNRAQILPEALNCLLNQTYRNTELIISDHASTDDTEMLIRKYMKTDRRIRYIKQSQNITAVANFNAALKEANGEFFMWAADDDRWDKHYIETLVNLLLRYHTAVVAVTNISHFKNKTSYEIKKHGMVNPVKQINSIIHYLDTGRVFYFYGLFRTAILKKIGGYHTDFRPFYKGSDHLTVFKAILFGNITFDDKILYFQRDSGYHYQRFDVFKKMATNKQVADRILRYLSMPMFYIFDFVLALRYTIVSKLSLKHKIIVTYHIFNRCIGNFAEFIKTISGGIYAFCRGLLDHSILK